MSTKTPGKITRKLTDNVVTFLSLKSQIARLTKQAEALKNLIDAECDVLAKENRFENGQLTVPNGGIVKVALNPPKIVIAATGKPLTELDKIKLVKLLGKDYAITDVNVTKIMTAIERQDPLILAALVGNGVKCTQGSRFEVKPIPA